MTRLRPAGHSFSKEDCQSQQPKVGAHRRLATQAKAGIKIQWQATSRYSEKSYSLNKEGVPHSLAKRAT
ncbi:MAG: hypothetical protein AAB538_01990, partial [Patescibacteria group bacterium]